MTRLTSPSTSAERWLTARDPAPLLRALEGQASARKLRLYSVACCEHIRHLLPERVSRHALRTARLFADGWATEEERTQALEAAAAVATGAFAPEAACRTLEEMTISGVITLIGKTEDALADDVVRQARLKKVKRVAAWVAAERAQVLRLHGWTCTEWVREIFGNPWEPVALDPYWLTWRDRTIVNLARQIYERHDFQALPLLVDALEEAGCSEPTLLDHLRAPGPHARGCWALDQLLGLC